MKRIFTLLSMVIITLTGFSQSPGKFSYQAIVRDSYNNLIKNSYVGTKTYITRDATGELSYRGQYNATANSYGLISVEIGTYPNWGTISEVAWYQGPYTIKMEIDCDYDGTFDITYTNHLLSVPYAMYANTTDEVTETNLSDILSIDNNANGKQIKNIAQPTNDNDAATKSYVDDIMGYIYNQMGGGSVKDIDGNVYKTVKIGNQVWMAENLRVTHFYDGSDIPLITDNSEWSSKTLGYCYYENDSAKYAKTYGVLYKWYTVMKSTTTESTRGVCPEGWHVPSYSEWSKMITFLGGEYIAGGKLKEEGTIHWRTPNEGADNSSLFNALPAGRRFYNDGTFHYTGANTTFWTSTKYDNGHAYRLYLDYNVRKITHNYDDIRFGFSVRCIKNQ